MSVPLAGSLHNAAGRVVVTVRRSSRDGNAACMNRGPATDANGAVDTRWHLNSMPPLADGATLDIDLDSALFKRLAHKISNSLVC
jgi:hypothetical protein